MKKFIVERNVPGAGSMTTDELVAMSGFEELYEVITLMGKPASVDTVFCYCR